MANSSVLPNISRGPGTAANGALRAVCYSQCARQGSWGDVNTRAVLSQRRCTLAASEKLHNDAAYGMHSILKLVDLSEGQTVEAGGNASQWMAPILALAAAAGPGSATQQQLHSLLTSALKLAALLGRGESRYSMLSVQWSAAAALCSARLLAGSGATAISAGVPSAAEGDGASSWQGVVYLGIEDSPFTGAPCDPLDQLPWAVLYGRCCLLWAQQLEQELPMLLEGQEQNQQQPWQQIAQADALAGDCPVAVMWLRPASGAYYSSMELYAPIHTTWLDENRVDERLSAAGYQPQHAVQVLLEVMTARDEAAGSSDPAALRVLVQALQAAGEALGCLATPVCCNNRACYSLGGATERCRWCRGRGAAVLGAGQPATATVHVSEPTGSSTSRCARHWLPRQLQQPHSQQNSLDFLQRLAALAAAVVSTAVMEMVDIAPSDSLCMWFTSRLTAALSILDMRLSDTIWQLGAHLPSAPLIVKHTVNACWQ